MKLIVAVHQNDKGGYWAEIPAVSSSPMQGDSLCELLTNLHETIETNLAVRVQSVQLKPGDRSLEISV